MPLLRLFTHIVTIFALLMLAACGGGGGGGGSSVVSPSISVQPSAVTAYETQTATFSVTVTDNGNNLAYQWMKNGVAISGATAASYVRSNLSVADSGAVFYVAISSAAGTLNSNTVTLTVKAAAPSISTAPTSQAVDSGQTVTFTVSADGLPPLSYQWYKNGRSITGGTGSSYSVAVVNYNSGDQYAVQVLNKLGTSIKSNTASLTVNATALGDLTISEVSSCYYSNVDCWFEIYNPTNVTIDLSKYKINSFAVSPSLMVTTATFSIPTATIAAKSYVILSGNSKGLNQTGTNLLLLGSSSLAPFWLSSGYLEIVNTARTQTIDYVKFGPSSSVSGATPTTPSSWTGSAFAATSGLTSGATSYGVSMVRPYPISTNTKSAADWVTVTWATPGGRNDVPVGAVDADNDGIPDSAEVSGGTFGGLDLYAMGARTGQKDIFIEVDYMNSTDAGIIPNATSLQMVVDAFAKQSIAVHFDAGTLFSADFSTNLFNLGQGSNQVAYEKCVTLDITTCVSNTSQKRSIWDWKSESMDLRRRAIFHYLLMGNSQLDTGVAESSGLAETPGNDILITMGSWGFVAGSNTLINMQAATIMHELGHNLGLQHGGNEGTNYKPNYYSVMNYMYQLSGLDSTPTGSTAYERWRYEKGDGTPTLCNFSHNSPCGSPSQFLINYSNGSSVSLNELQLYERNNIGRGTATVSDYADWNLSSSMTSSAIVRDLNADGSYTTLTDYNDWANLIFPFRRYFGGNSGQSLNQMSEPAALDVIGNDMQAYTKEFAPSERILRHIKHEH